MNLLATSSMFMIAAVVILVGAVTSGVAMVDFNSILTVL